MSAFSDHVQGMTPEKIGAAWEAFLEMVEPSDREAWQDAADEYGEAFQVFVTAVTGSTPASLDEDNVVGVFQDCYMGEYQSDEDWAAEYLADTGQLDDGATLAQYFDHERFCRDLTFDGWTFVQTGWDTCHVFCPDW